MTDILAGFILGMLLVCWFFPEHVGKWLYEVDEARYENVVDQ